MLTVKNVVFKAGKTIIMAMKVSVIAERNKIKHGASKQYTLVWLQTIFPGTFW